MKVPGVYTLPRAMAAHKGTIGRPTWGPGGPLDFSDLGEIRVKQFSGRVWGEIGPPKGFLGTIQTIPLAKNPGKPRGGPIPPQSYIFRAPFLGPKRGPEKYNFVEGLVPHEVSQDFLRGEWFVWYPGTLWVDQFPPKPSQKIVLHGFPPNPKNPGAPLGLMWACLLSLCGLPLPLVMCKLQGPSFVKTIGSFSEVY